MANADAVRWFGGARTLAEQMTGLELLFAELYEIRPPLLSVLDLGCAEGLIALEFAKAGASRVVGIECNAESVKVAREHCGELVRIEHANLNMIALPTGPWDIVLALAILHKLRDPAQMISDIVGTGAGLVVVRLPGGSSGSFLTKHYGTLCDVNKEFASRGYALETCLPGPRDELVQYWRKC